MANDVTAPGSTGPGAGAVNLTFGDGTTMAMDRDFAKELDGKFDRLIASADGGKDNYDRGDNEYYTVNSIVDSLDDAGISAARGVNTAGLDETSTDFSEDLAWLFSQQQGAAERSGKGDLGFIASVGRSFSNALAEQIPDDKPAAATGSKPAAATGAKTGNAPSQEAVGDVRELLDDAKSSSNSSEKSSLLSDAIQALISAIRGETPEKSGPTEGRAGDLQDQIEDIADSLAGSPEAKAGSAAEGDASAKPGPQMNSTTFAGDELMGKLEASGDKALKFDDSDQGIGIKDDEIGKGEQLTFRAPERAEQGSVDIVDLFGDENGNQEVAKLKVFDGDKLVKEIEVRGDMDGNQTVDIDVPFDRIEMTSDGKGSDFALKSVTVESEGTDAPEAAAPSDDVPGAWDGEFKFDNAQLLSLLEALSGTLGLVDGSSELSEEQKDAILDKVGDLLESIVGALDEGGEGGASISPEELVGIVESVEGLNSGIEANVEDGAEKNDALDGLADALSQIFSALEGGGTSEPANDEPEVAIA